MIDSIVIVGIVIERTAIESVVIESIAQQELTRFACVGLTILVMQMRGSCHCGAVCFELESRTPYPFNYCYCTTCRKTAGGGGYAINLSGDAATLCVTGEECKGVYRPGHVDEHDGSVSPQERHFCTRCGSALWVFDPRWPDLVHPYASAVDSELPATPERNHLMLDFKASWVPVHPQPEDRMYPRYPDETIAEWHDARRWTQQD